VNRTTALTHKQQAFLSCLLIIAMASPMHAIGARPFVWLPEWIAGGVGLGAVLGMCLVFWASGALRIGFLACFVATFAVAAAAGRLLGALT
jgi:hypothetical protein